MLCLFSGTDWEENHEKLAAELSGNSRNSFDDEVSLMECLYLLICFCFVCFFYEKKERKCFIFGVLKALSKIQKKMNYSLRL